MLRASDLRGIVPPVVTPLDGDGEIDERGLRRLAEYLIAGGVGGLFLLGSSAEAVSLLPAERRRVCEIMFDATSDSLPRLVGVSAPGFAEVLQNIEMVADFPADAIVCTPPFYFGYDHGEVLDFYYALAERSPIPLFLYNMPLRTRHELTLEQLLRLADHPKIIGLKDTSGSFQLMLELIRGLEGRDDFALFQGDERLLTSSVLQGCHGGVVGLANLAPRLCADAYAAAAVGDREASWELQGRINELFQVFFTVGTSGRGPVSVGNTIGGLKLALELLGLCSRRCRFPAKRLTDGDADKIAAILRSTGLLSSPE